jgi:hypothetical protein
MWQPRTVIIHSYPNGKRTADLKIPEAENGFALSTWTSDGRLCIGLFYFSP